MGGEPVLVEEDVEIEPLLGKPHFHSLMVKSHVKSPYCMNIPAKFDKMLPCKSMPVILHYGPKSWEMTYQGDYPFAKRFDYRWKAFAEDNKLKVGDICIFELLESEPKLSFKVQILRGDFPSALLGKTTGTAPTNPVVIVDD